MKGKSMNEILLIVSLIVFNLLVLIWYKLFGLKGLYCFSVFAVIAANIEVMILIEAFGMEQTLGNVLFATTFLITDIVSETEGKEESNRIVNTGILVSVMFALITNFWKFFTPSNNDFAMAGISIVFSNTPRVIFASLVVFAIVQKFDVWLYHKWWSFTEKKFNDKKKYLYIRNNGSTLISQFLNAVLFNLFAFYGIHDMQTILSIIITSYLIYIVTSLADTPIVYLARKIHDKKAASN